ncbi:MAG: hypothetical protein DRO88_10880 [Promethearchaeia archaeon]|nr:MAG: hypothetical protein DRO88_10880 [Candidatus Lokiarchaeia archaeon]
MVSQIDALNTKIIDLLHEFNQLIQGVIQGPNCIDPNICHGDCCFVHLDVPKALCEYCVSHGLAKPSNFKRSTIFSFQVKMDLKTLKCPFFSHEINGCAVHFSGAKIPQCWVYPTGLDVEHIEHACKRAEGWDIVELEKAAQAQQVLNRYILLCKQEAEEEQSLKEVLNRLQKISYEKLIEYAPAHISGLEDAWNSFDWIVSETWNLGLKSLCESISCNFSYFECHHVCPSLKNAIQKKLPALVKKHHSIYGYKNQLLFSDLIRIMSEYGDV